MSETVKSPPICETCRSRPCMEQIYDSWGPDYCTRCGPCIVDADVVEICSLRRASNVAIAHIAKGDAAGALAALTMQRDTPGLFKAARFDGET